jgi:SPP1 gp7 family putative phage head morphogenesis protein
VAAAAALLLLRAKRSLRALLLVEKRALDRLRHVARAIVDAAIVQIARSQSRMAAMLIVRRTMVALAHAIERELVAIRREARAASRGTVGDLAPPRRGLHERDQEDETAAHAAAQSYASAWAAAALAIILSGDGERVDVDGINARDAHLGRIAATEAARAFNDERRRARMELSPDEWVQVWSALLDGRTCGQCRRQHGETRALHEYFTDAPPVHPNCRCIVELVPLSELTGNAA